MAESREQALDRMMADAERLSANAVVGVRCGTSQLMNAAVELIAYGAAVVIEDK